jgi:hypothetical protein
MVDVGEEDDGRGRVVSERERAGRRVGRPGLLGQAELSGPRARERRSVGACRPRAHATGPPLCAGPSAGEGRGKWPEWLVLFFFSKM